MNIFASLLFHGSSRGGQGKLYSRRVPEPSSDTTASRSYPFSRSAEPVSVTLIARINVFVKLDVFANYVYIDTRKLDYRLRTPFQ